MTDNTKSWKGREASETILSQNHFGKTVEQFPLKMITMCSSSFTPRGVYNEICTSVSYKTLMRMFIAALLVLTKNCGLFIQQNTEDEQSTVTCNKRDKSHITFS